MRWLAGRAFVCTWRDSASGEQIHQLPSLVMPCCRGMRVLYRSEQERVRRRDLISALRSRREQMLATLKRDGRSANRCLPVLDHNMILRLTVIYVHI